MEKNFWEQLWLKSQIGFHLPEAHPLLVKHLSELALSRGQRIFLPLCGKTLDIPYLLSLGFKVVGSELIEIAIKQLFAELKIVPTITQTPKLKRYSAHDIDIFVGDIFDLTPELLGPINGVYDRAALVALPQDVRPKYSKHLGHITQDAPQLLITFEYDQSQADGPPFSLSAGEIKQHYEGRCEVKLTECLELSGGLKGKYPALEKVWSIKKR